MSDLLTPKQLAGFLALSERTTRELLATGTIPSYKIGAARRIARADVDHYLAARREGAP